MYTPRARKSMINLSDVELEIKKGEFVVVIGEVGSGKSSLMNAMNGEMIYIPQNEINFIGDKNRKLSSEE